MNGFGYPSVVVASNAVVVYEQVNQMAAILFGLLSAIATVLIATKTNAEGIFALPTEAKAASFGLLLIATLFLVDTILLSIQGIAGLPAGNGNLSQVQLSQMISVVNSLLISFGFILTSVVVVGIYNVFLGLMGVASFVVKKIAGRRSSKTQMY